MSDRIRVTVALELRVDDAEEMRRTAFERLKAAWSGDDDFPYDSPDEVPLEQVVHSTLADAIPGDLPGCRRSQLKVEVDSQSADEPQPSSEAPAEANDDAQSGQAGEDSHDSAGDGQSRDGDASDTESRGAESDDDGPAAEATSKEDESGSQTREAERS